MKDLKHYQEEYKKHGFLKIKDFLPKEDLLDLKKYIKSTEDYKKATGVGNDSVPPMTKAINVQKIKYRNDTTVLEDWLDKKQSESGIFKSIPDIVGRNLLRTNNHVIEVCSGKHTGLNWHVGYYSFSYTKIEDYGATLWIPLDPITEKQKGGMKYISTSDLNGDFIYSFASWYFDHLGSLNPGKDYLTETVSDTHMVNQVTKLIENDFPKKKEFEYNFNVGDAFLFNKSVVHRTSEFLEGKLKDRMAIVVRFVGEDARFDKERFYSIFTHLKKATLSNGIDTPYMKLSDNKDIEETIKPEDPFLAQLVPIDHLTPFGEIPFVKEAKPPRLLKRKETSNTQGARRRVRQSFEEARV